MTRGQFDLFGGDTTVTPAPVPAALQTLAGRLPPRLRLGTSSWSFPGWRGIVYGNSQTETALAREGLQAYAQHPLLRTVSIDRTYYRPIDAQSFADYADVVPPDFRFLVKADRLLTLPDATAAPAGGKEAPSQAHYLDAEYAAFNVIDPAVRGLGERLQAIVFQFSPGPAGRYGGVEGFADALDAFLAALPRGPCYAVELRTPALMSRMYVETLQHHGAAHCYSVHPAMMRLDRQLRRMPAAANPLLLIRWMLRQGYDYESARMRYEPFNRIVDVDVEARAAIADACVDALAGERDVGIYINNKAEGSAPLSAFALAEVIAGRLEASG